MKPSDLQPKIGLSYEDVSPRKYKLIREGDGLTAAGNKILWIDWEMRRFAWMNFQITTKTDSKLSYTPCYALVPTY